MVVVNFWKKFEKVLKCPKTYKKSIEKIWFFGGQIYFEVPRRYIKKPNKGIWQILPHRRTRTGPTATCTGHKKQVFQRCYGSKCECGGGEFGKNGTFICSKWVYNINLYVLHRWHQFCMDSLLIMYTCVWCVFLILRHTTNWKNVVVVNFWIWNVVVVKVLIILQMWWWWIWQKWYI